MKTTTTISESRLQQNCFLWHWNNHPAERGRLWMNYNNAKNQNHGAILKGMGMVSGVADMTYLRADGKPVFIELKVSNRGQSPEQKKWADLVRECNAYYYVARTEDEFQAIIEQHSETSPVPGRKN